MTIRTQLPKGLCLLVAVGYASSLLGCATSDEIPPLQEHAFSDEPLFDGVRFFMGPWYAPGRDYAYQYSDGVMILSDASDKGYVLRAFEVHDCAGLSDAYEELIASIAETVDFATGRRPVPMAEVVVLDGPSYTLRYSAGLTATNITLDGGGNAEHTVPWVASAKRLRELGLECADNDFAETIHPE